MGNKSKQQERTRRAQVEELRRAQRAAERRKTVVFVVIAAVVGLGIVAAAAIPMINRARNDPTKRAIASFGVPAAQASCTPVKTAAARGAGQHVQPGTIVKYSSAPPSFGTHDGEYLRDPRRFYSRRDRPAIEKLVHSLEHGYTIVWYDDTVTGQALDDLQGLAVRMPVEKNPGRWFMVAPWTAQDAKTRGTFPAGEHIAISHWGAQQGALQYCGSVSGEVVARFVEQWPATNAPEPGGV